MHTRDRDDVKGCILGGNMRAAALNRGMWSKVTPGEDPIEIERVEAIEREGEPHWLIVGVPRRIRHPRGACVEMTSYVVPKNYRGMRAA